MKRLYFFIIPSITRRKWSVEGTLGGSVRPSTDDAAGGSRTHAAGIRAVSQLGKVQLPGPTGRAYIQQLCAPSFYHSLRTF